MRERSGRYSLIVFDNKTMKKYIIELMEDGKLHKKVDITTIDLFFVDPDMVGGFYNAEEFRTYLNQQIEDETHQRYNISSDFAVYITYISNKKGEGGPKPKDKSIKPDFVSEHGEKCLDVIYRDAITINFFAYEYSKLREEYRNKFSNKVMTSEERIMERNKIYNKIKLAQKSDEKSIWEEFAVKFLIAIHDSGTYYRDLFDKCKYSPFSTSNYTVYNENILCLDNNQTNEFNEAKKNIEKDLVGYKNIRAAQLAFDRYDKKGGRKLGLDSKRVEVELVISKTNDHLAKTKIAMDRQYTKEEYAKTMAYTNPDSEESGGVQMVMKKN